MQSFSFYAHQILPLIFIVILVQHHSTSCLAARTLNDDNNNDNDDQNSDDFIRKSCNTTTYPELCYSTLSDQVNQVQNDPKELACAALNATLGEAHLASAMIKSFPKPKDRESYAVKDCMEELKDALEELRMSFGEMERASPDDSDFKFRVNNVQTWVSAALTDDDTCMDGIEQGQGQLGNNTQNYTSVRDEVVKVTHLTSVALALVNNYAASVQY